MRNDIAAHELREMLHYAPETGVFTWTNGGCGRSGMTAGGAHNRGYWQINIRNKLYLAHRLAWLYIHDVWPPSLMDHIDGDRMNNTIINLRLATSLENCRNAIARSKKPGALKGTYFSNRRQKWVAQIGINHKNVFLGYYESAEAAHAAYAQRAREVFGEFARIA